MYLGLYYDVFLLTTQFFHLQEVLSDISER